MFKKKKKKKEKKKKKKECQRTLLHQHIKLYYQGHMRSLRSKQGWMFSKRSLLLCNHVLIHEYITVKFDTFILVIKELFSFPFCFLGQ